MCGLLEYLSIESFDGGDDEWQLKATFEEDVKSNEDKKVKFDDVQS